MPGSIGPFFPVEIWIGDQPAGILPVPALRTALASCHFFALMSFSASVVKSSPPNLRVVGPPRGPACDGNWAFTADMPRHVVRTSSKDLELQANPALQ